LKKGLEFVSHSGFLESPYLTVSELSHYLKLPAETVYKYVRDGRIPASKVGRHWRFQRGEIDRWVRFQRESDLRPLQVLVVDDEEVICRLLSRWLTDAGCQAHTASSGRDAVSLFRATPFFDLVTLDLCMPGMTGVEVLRELRAVRQDVMIAIVTADVESRLLDEALELGPVIAMKKPIYRQAFLMMVNCLIGCGRGVAPMETLLPRHPSAVPRRNPPTPSPSESTSSEAEVPQAS